MKATELLQRQHREIEQLLERLKSAGPGDEKAIRDQLAAILVAHSVIEQEHFYPALREVAPDQILEAFEEHGLMDYELARDLSTRPGDATMRAKSAVLGEVVLRHVRKEETDLFKRADSALTNEELSELGEQMMVRFNEVREKGYARFLAKALQENMPRLPGRTTTGPRTARRAPAAEKKETARAKRGPAKRGPAKRGPAKRATSKRATSKRATPKRGPAKRGEATTQAKGTRRTPATRGATGARKGAKASGGARGTSRSRATG